MPNQNYDIVSIQNIDDEEFVFEYDRSAGNYPHVIPAGEVKRFPRFLAEHAVKHLIDKILNKRKERTSNTMLREALAEQIVIDEEVLQEVPKKAAKDELKEQVDRLNQPSELEGVLKRHRSEKKEEINTSPPIAESTPKQDEKFAGLDVIDTTDPVEVKPVEVKPMPTRAEILDYGKNKMGMEFDKDMQKKVDKMKVPELLKEIGDPREDLSNG